MTASHRLRALSLAALAALFVVSCKQGEGEPCDVDEDCAEPLVCSCEFDGVRRGVCVPRGSEGCPGAPSDAGPPRDSGTEDGGASDAGVDAGADAGRDAGADAGADGGTDAGADGGTDAGTTMPGDDAGASDAGPDGG
ncbi:MAG TPA: hypothetical protein VIL20_16790 [Sandaracinaceae bacterium]